MDQLLLRIHTQRVFVDSDAPCCVLDLNLVIRAVNPAYLTVTGRGQDDLVGLSIFEAFPANPDDPDADWRRSLRCSLEAVLGESRRHRMPLQRHDLRSPAPGEAFVRRYWDVVNSPLRDDDGRVLGILHHVEDVTPVVDAALATSGTTSEQGLSGADITHNLVRMLVHETLAHDQTRVEVEQLRTALASRVVIEQAKGVVVATLGCTPDQAFAALRNRARSTSRRLHDVCRDVIAAAGDPEAGADATPVRWAQADTAPVVLSRPDAPQAAGPPSDPGPGPRPAAPPRPRR
jgi:PAS domain S-box-containing protein